MGAGNPIVLTISQSQWVFLTAIDSFGCTAADSFLVTNNALDIALPDDIILCPGEQLELEVLVTDPQDSVVQLEWSPTAIFLDPLVNPATVVGGLPGVYTLIVEATSANGCLVTDSLMLTVIDTVLDATAVTTSVCSQGTVLFALNAPGASGYTWLFGDPTNPMASASGALVSYQYPGPGTYLAQAYVQTSTSCTDTIVIPVVIPDESISIAFDWSYASCADTAVVQLTNLSVNPGSSFVEWAWWINGSLVDTTESIQVVLSSSSALSVELIGVSANGCRDTLLTMLDIPVIESTLPDTVFVCPGDSVQLNPLANPAYLYSWSPESLFADPAIPSPWVSSDTSLLLTVDISFILPDSCTFQDAVFLEVLPLPQYSLPPDSIRCDTLAIISLDVVPPATVDWYADPDRVDYLATGSQILYPLKDTTDFYLTIRSPEGCTIDDSIQVITKPILVDLFDRYVICTLDSVVIWPMLEGDTSSWVWQWEGMGPHLMGPDGSLTVYPGGEGLWEILVENSFGCAASANTLVEIAAQTPFVSASASPGTILSGGSSQLNVQTDPGNTIQWIPANSLTDPSASDPVAMPDSTTTYTVIVTDMQGCTGSDQVTVRLAIPICEDPYIFVPNTFTPNNDGNNDVLFVRGGFIDEMWFIIHDRWGNQVFESRDPDLGWDGRYQGQLLSTDVFGYYLEVRCFNGETFTHRGNVTLLRN